MSGVRLKSQTSCSFYGNSSSRAVLVFAFYDASDGPCTEADNGPDVCLSFFGKGDASSAPFCSTRRHYAFFKNATSSFLRRHSFEAKGAFSSFFGDFFALQRTARKSFLTSTFTSNFSTTYFLRKKSWKCRSQTRRNSLSCRSATCVRSWTV